jgi:putative glutamine amidotransferase
MTRPIIIGIPCDHRMMGPHPFHMVGEKYIVAIREASGAVSLLIPVLTPPIPPPDILASVDGLLFTGSYSNVAPRLYGGTAPRSGVLQDEYRDATTLPLMQAAIDAGMPCLCICRGFQELNVMLGGTLHQHLGEVSGRANHLEDKSAPLDDQYGPAHDVRLTENGVLARLTGAARIRVNSLHEQGIDKLAPPLAIEAAADDGTIEAVSLPGARGFLLGVQWHPEWKWSENPVSRGLFAAFGDAVAASAGR